MWWGMYPSLMESILVVEMMPYLSFLIAATEIQNIQIAEGDVCRALTIPIYMIFPRLFTCPTLATSNFKIGKYRISRLCILFNFCYL